MFQTDTAIVDEQAIIAEAADKLSKFGEVKLESITDNLNPHSGIRVPDLVFVPQAGPNKDVVHIVEFKPTRDEILPSVMVFNSLHYKRQIQEANPELKVRYALSSNGQVIVDDNEEGEVMALPAVHDAQELADKIVDWSGASEKQDSSPTSESAAEN